MTDLHHVDWTALPPPRDDGAADHLSGARLKNVSPPSTAGGPVDIAALDGLSVVYAYPMTGQPGVPLPDGWDAIPGARGCTPQSCAFRDHAAELKALGVKNIFGLSTQPLADQAEAARRLHLPFALVSDEGLSFAKAMGAPTFEVEGRTLLKRLTLIIEDGVIVAVFYPVFPPDGAPAQVIHWLQERPKP